MSPHTSSTKFFVFLAVLFFIAVVAPTTSPAATNTNPNDPLIIPNAPTGNSIVSQTGDTYDGTGDWVITQPTEYTSETVVVNGDILIQDGGALILDSAAIRFNVSNALLNVSEEGYLEGHNSYLWTVGSQYDILGEYNISLYGNVSWTGGFIRHFDEVSMKDGNLNATFTDTEFSYGTNRIAIQGHKVSFTGCDFYEIDCDYGYLLHTVGGGLTGGLLIENCRFGIPDYYPAPQTSRGMIRAGNMDGGLEILSNLFYEVNAHGTTRGTVVRIDPSENAILADNRFIRCGGFLREVVYIGDDGCLVSGNRFFGNFRDDPSYDQVLYMGVDDIIVEKNFFWNNQFGSDIRIWAGQNVSLRWNTFVDGGGTAIQLGAEVTGTPASDCQVYGNALASNNLGVSIHEDSANHSVYLNFFMDNTLHAVDNNETSSWTNGTHGNFWDNYTGGPPNDNWIGDAFSPHPTIPEEPASLMIGTLPPSSGDWEIDIPHVFAMKDLAIDGDVNVTGPTGALVLFANKLECGDANSFTFGESTIFWLHEAELTTLDPSHEIAGFQFTDVFRFGGYRSSISNVRRYYADDSFTVSAVIVEIDMSNFTNLPHLEIDMASDYRLNYGQPMERCTIQDTIFMGLGNPHHSGGGLSVDWPNLHFRNNTVHMSASGKEVRLSSAYQAGFGYPWGPNVTAEGCTIVNASLNVTVIGYESVANITNCEVDEGIMAYSRYNGIDLTYLHIVGNTINSGGLDASDTEPYGDPHYAILTLEDNRIMGRTDLERISSGNIINSTFYDAHNALVIEDSEQLTIHNNTLDGDLFLTDCDQFQITDSRLAIVEFTRSESISFENCVFNSTGSMYFWRPAGIPNRQITFDNCTFDGLSWSMNDNDACEFLTFFDCTFYKTGFALGTNNLVNNVTIDSSKFFLDSGNAIDFRGHNATVTNNIIVGSGDTAIRLNDQTRGNNTVVTGNRIESFEGNGIRVRNSYSSIIEGNVIYDCFGYGIFVTVGNHSVISNNYVESVGGAGIWVEGFDPANWFVSVTNNVARDCSSYGMYLRYMRNTLVFNNTIVENQNYGLRVRFCGDSQFWMNVLYHNEDGNIDLQGSNHFFDNGTIGNFWGPSGPEGSEYCDSYYDGGPNPWIGDVPYEPSPGDNQYDNHPMLLSNPHYLTYPNVVTGPLYMDELLYVLNTTVYCENGIIVAPTGSLYFIGTRVTFQDDGSYTQHIEIHTGGSLTLMGGARFMANQTTNTYGFVLRSGSSLIIDDAHISRCGYGTGNPGLLVNVTGVSVNELTVLDAPTGMVLSQDSMDIGNITFVDCGVGLLVSDCSSCTISSLEFSNVGTGVRFESVTDSYVMSVNFTGCNEFGLYLHSQNSDNTIVDNVFAFIGGTALNISTGGNYVYLNAFIENGHHIEHNEAFTNAYNNGTHGNFYLDYDGVDDDGNFIGDTPYSSSISDVVDSYPVMVYGSFPTADGWIVDRPTAVLNTNYTISGDVDVHEMLVLLNTRLWMNSTDSISHTITVHLTGDLRLVGAILRAVNSSHKFTMIAQAKSFIYLSDVNLVGLETFDLHTANIAIENTTFTDINRGLRLLGASISDLVFENCTVDSALNTGFYVGSGINNITIRDWVFYSAETAIHVDQGVDIFIEDIHVDNCTTGVSYHGNSGILSVTNSDFYRTQNVIDADTADLLFVDGIHGYLIEAYGIRVSSVGNATILNSHIEMTGGGRSYHIDQYVDWYLISNSYGFNATAGVTISPHFNDHGTHGSVTGGDFRNCTMGIEFVGSNQIVYLNVTDTFLYGCDVGFKGHALGVIRVAENEFLYCGTAIDAMNLNGSFFENNEIQNSEYGFFTENDDFHDCLIAGNSYLDVDYPVYVKGPQSNFTITDETIVNCVIGIYLDGRYAWMENVFIENIHVTGSTDSAVQLYWSRNITLFGSTIENFEDGVVIDHSEMIFLNQTAVTDGVIGVRIEDWSSLTMRHCIISGASTQAIQYGQESITVDIDTSNTVEGLPAYSFYGLTDEVLSGFETYHLAILQSNNVTLVSWNVHRMDRLSILQSGNITIANSTLDCDVYIDSDDVTFVGNIFESAEEIEVYSRMDSSIVTMYLNAFRTQYLFERGGWPNAVFMLNGTDYGNYWYNYEGVDSDGDGIGDDPFLVSGSGTYDYLPLMVDPSAYDVYINIIHPSDGDAFLGLLAVSVEVQVVVGIYYEGDGSAETVITLDGVVIFTGDDGEIEFEYDTSQLTDGVYTFRVTTTVDSSDDFIQEIQLTIDNTPPALEPSIEDEEATTDRWPYWSVEASDALSDLKWIAVFLDGDLVNNETQHDSTGTLYFDLEFTDDGAYELCFMSSDVIGNIGKFNLTVYFDTTPPQLSSPGDVSYEEGTTGHTVTWQGSDLTASHYNVTLNGVSYIDSDWDGSDIVIEIDGLDVGLHTLEINVYDRVGHSSNDAVQIEVTEPTEPTDTTDPTEPTGPTDPTEPVDDIMLIVLVAGIAVGAVVVVIVLLQVKKKSAG